ncbi:CBS domain-containing protein [Actinocatenispora rupis]|uniref:CBS domain-containing protein n=1 Tax=Actinocatenispora rupis TaxID=519421 RepID=A0A8J3J4C2_9ACTN|nr:CBS domain-containing protein [Actinocatenispora rupis]GID15566.1 hypothetical protein Aru02nite_64550 [Actinocatenispora rupis]
MRASDAMSRPVHAVGPDDPIEQAAAMLIGYEVTAAPVLDSYGRIVGIVSEGDLLRHRVPTDPTLHMRRHADGTDADRPHTVRDVMTSKVVTTPPEADLADVAATMLDRDVRSVPVVDDDELVGIVSRRDIVRSMVRTDAVLQADAQHRLDEYAGSPRWTVTVHRAEATVTGTFRDEVERQIATVLTRTVPGICAAHVPA